MKVEAKKILMSIFVGIPGLLLSLWLSNMPFIIPMGVHNTLPAALRDPWLYYIGGLIFGFFILAIRYAVRPEQQMKGAPIWIAVLGIIIGVVTMIFNIPLMIIFCAATLPASGYHYIYVISSRQNKEKG